ncbi:PTS transporter subunit EIIC [Tepidimicrobium xylanilyticum]|uniref:PTS system, maltose and glucose-specific IIC component n=1 Tax=Tepidimicrobium xylanilyticum TaxID=1123352 RepID=A0A1H2QAD9_9FIRM|nr:PTS transporter subunit EIIC [Tepidimicrobium xylanilyticum]GMG95720.1 PTS sugar transporter subunit IIABC [Tepidimicrobium xylanilyticum]SDW03379.1 PTS system, maltose and glucose-specific IIC component [Tepidimicrobium xylanilyticum]
MFEKLQRLGKAFMIPIAVLPIAGIMLGVGAAFTNPLMVETYGLTKILGQGTFLYYVLTVMSNLGSAVFNNLPLIFAVGIAGGLALQEKGAAALSAAISFIVMHTVISVILGFQGYTPETTSVDYFMSQGLSALEATKQSNVFGYELGIFTVKIGVLGGIIVGVIVSILTNRYYDKKLPDSLSFFSGVRFVPIISVLTVALVGAIIPFIWPTVHLGISTFSEFFGRTGGIGMFFYGSLMRLLNIFGLHHAIYPLFWYTPLGGELEVAGKLIQGGQNIFFAQLADPNTVRFSAEATKYFTGGFLPMMFGLPAAALAMYRVADDKNKKAVGSLLFSAALTSFLTGITEPIEFTFLFVAPVLYGIHAVLEGLSYAILYVLDVAVGVTFSRGIIDFTLFGLLQGNAKTNYIWILILGIPTALIYYYVFKILIVKLDLKTPGRGDSEEVKLYTRKDTLLKEVDVSKVIEALGGKENLEEVDACITRLRVTVSDVSKVADSDVWTKELKAKGVFKKGNGVQIVYGALAEILKNEINKQL